MSAVAFKLAFARTSCSDSAAKTRQRLTLTGKARQGIFKLSQLNLKLALPRSCPCGKDVENEHCSVNHAHTGKLFKVALLRRSKLTVKNQQIHVLRRAESNNFRKLSGADKGGGFGSFPFLNQLSEYLGARRVRKLLKLVNGNLGVKFARINGNKQGFFLFPFIFIHFHGCRLLRLYYMSIL